MWKGAMTILSSRMLKNDVCSSMEFFRRWLLSCAVTARAEVCRLEEEAIGRKGHKADFSSSLGGDLAYRSGLVFFIHFSCYS